MKNSLLKTAMKHSISDVLETMFFLPLDFSDTRDVFELWYMEKIEIIAAKLNFNGPISGCAVFCIPKRVALSITADFMGKKEEEVSDDQVYGSVKEIINMIIGNTFSMYQPEATFNLGIPELVDCDEVSKDLSNPEKNFSIIIEALENHLAFQMNIET
jgi:CheY-specific phosphatase CheX